jgi:hypothetical protein
MNDVGLSIKQRRKGSKCLLLTKFLTKYSVVVLAIFPRWAEVQP